MKKRILSLMLVLCMVFTMVPSRAFATEGTEPIGASSVTDSGESAVCQHEHNEHCGYLEAVGGADCTHECKLCKPTEVQPDQPQADCNCETKCTLADEENAVEESVKADCPVCGVENADLSLCKAQTLPPAQLNAVERAFTLSGQVIQATLAGDLITGDGYSFDSDTGTLTVTTNGGTRNWRSDERIVGSGSTKNYTVVQSVSIGSDVAEIGTSAFENCTALTELELPQGLTRILSNAFENCTALTSVDFGNNTSLNEIGRSAFEKCTKLKTVNFADCTGLKNIGNYAFKGCTALTEMELPNGITKIGAYAFESTALTSVTIPASVSNIEEYINLSYESGIFKDCQLLQTVVFENNSQLGKIGSFAFKGCKALTSVDFGNSSMSVAIASYAFDGCIALTSIDIPVQISSIDSYAFTNCSNLETVNFKRMTAPKIYENVFYRAGTTKGHVTITVPEDAIGYNSDNWSKFKYNTLFPEDKQNLDAPAVPQNISFSFDGDNAGKLMGSKDSMEYRLSDSTWWSCSENTPLPMNGITTYGIRVRVKSVGYTPASEEMYIPITQADKPVGLTAEVATGGDSNGKIKGTTAAMEYSTISNFTKDVFPCADGETTGLAAGTYYVRVKATGTVLASTNTEIKVKAEVTVPDAGSKIYTGTTLKSDLVTNDFYTVNTNYGGINVGTYNVVLTLKKTIYIWSDGTTTSKTIPFTITKAAAKDLTAAPAINYGTETIATTTGMEYKVGVGGTWTACTANMSPTAFGWDGSEAVTVQFRAKNDANHETSIVERTLTIPARPAAPATSSFTITKPFKGGSDGKLSGITAAMEYKTDSEVWTAGTGTALTGITEGTSYTIRFKATDVAFASETVNVTMTSKTDVSGQITFANGLTTYNGMVQIHETAVRDAGVTGGSFVYTYTTADGTLDGGKPKGAGTYTVTAKYETDTVMGVKTATFTIEKKSVTVQADNKSMSKGDALPALTYNVTGLVNGDNITTDPTMEIATDGNTVGTFDITISGGVVDNSANYSIIYINGTLTVTDAPTVTHTITATAGTGGTISPSGSVAVNNGESKTFIITPNSNYSIAEVKVDGVSQGIIASYTFENITANHTISATFSYNGGSSGGGSSSGDESSSGGGSSDNHDSNITVTPPPAEEPNTPTEANIKVDGKVNSDGNATVNITDKAINDAYNKALADARKNGNEANGIILVLNVDTGNKTANSLTVYLPKTVQDTIISRKIMKTVVVVDDPDIKIDMDLYAVKEINKQAKADVEITATKQDKSKLSSKAKKAIGTRPVFDLKVNYGSGKQVSDFGSGSVVVEIPYTLGANEKAGNLHAIYIDAKGNVQWLTNSVYDSVNKVIRFSTNHFSTYGVGYKTVESNFTDIISHWAKDSIDFVVARGFMSGTSATTFSPNTGIKRGELVTALGRLAEVDVSKFKTSSFSDVKDDAYYMAYVEWATKNSIVDGISADMFDPDSETTREQMAVIMANYAKAIGFSMSKVYEENIFTDDVNIGAWAKDAVKQMQMAGIIRGKEGNKFNPRGTATRAEVCAVLKRFVELMISSDTAQGWVRNDSGKWMYYENGKALTGEQTIGGVSYTFNSYGETKDTPKELSTESK